MSEKLCFTDFTYTLKEKNGFETEVNSWDEAMDYLAITPDATLETTIEVIEGDNFLNEISDITWDGNTEQI